MNPVKFLTDALPYQNDAADKLGPIRIGALLMEMGTGKTRTACEIVGRRAKKIDRVVYFCPVSLKETVRREILKHIEAARIYEFKDSTTLRTLPRDADWYIIGIESMSTSRRTILAVVSLVDKRTMVVVDESPYIKGQRASRTRWITDIGNLACYRLIMTGEAITQGLEDLYAQMRFLSPDILGYRSFYSYANNHLEYSDKYPGKIVACHNMALIAAKVAPYVYQVTKREVLKHIPDKRYEERWCTMTRAQRELYEQAKEEILREAEESTSGQSNSYLVYRLFGVLQQIACGFWHRIKRHRRTGEIQSEEMIEVPHRRLDLLGQTLSEIPDGAQAVIWVKYLKCADDVADMIAAELGPRDSVVRYDGTVSPRDRDKNLLRFSSGAARWFVGTPDSASHGLNELANVGFYAFYTNAFKYSHRIQAEDRGHRMKTVVSPLYVDHGVSDSIDERILRSLARKGDVANDFRKQVDRVRGERTFAAALRELAHEF